jgi:hypothetical protein
VSPDEERELRAIEDILGAPLPRVVIPDFDYDRQPDAAMELRLKNRAEDRPRGRARAGRPGGGKAGKAAGAAPKREDRQSSSSRPAAARRDREARLLAILDRHAPVTPGSAATPRRGGRFGR